MEQPKMGRPRKVIDFELVEKLAAIGCTQEEIAYACSISVDSLTRNKTFAEVYKKGDLAGKRSLRHYQYQLAAKGNAVMCIFLGKQRLGQKDIVVTEHAGEMTVHDGAKERLVSKLASLTGSIPAEEPIREGSQSIN